MCVIGTYQAVRRHVPHDLSYTPPHIFINIQCIDVQYIHFILLSLQNGDSTTVHHRSGVLQELVMAGADLNLQNEVRYTQLLATALQHVSFPAVHLGGSDSSHGGIKE